MHLYGLQQPPLLDFDRMSEWPAWIEHFDDYRFATGLHKRSREAQVCTLLYTMGRQAHEVFSTFGLSEEEAKDYEAVKKKFDGHFVKEHNIVYESACFHRHSQKPRGEHVDQFVTALHVLADRCDFGSLKERTIQDRLVVKLRDAKLLEALQLDSQLTLAPVLKESVKQQQCTLWGDDGQSSELRDQGPNVDAVAQQRLRQHGQVRPQVKPPPAQSTGEER